MARSDKPTFDLQALNWKPLLWLLLAFALVVRVLSYASGRSLWIDEAMLSLNIIQASFSQLMFHPMQYFQVAPLGFLAIEKTLVTGLGSSEFVLRLFPFCCSLLSVGLFYRLSRKTGLGPVALLVALGAFAASRGLVYYAGEVKQYASDVLITLSLLLLAYRVLAQPTDRSRFLGFALAGILAVWFAYPAFFVLLGLGLTLLVLLAQQKDRRGVLYILLCLLVWAGSMGVYYNVGLEAIRASSAHQAIWREVWDQQLAAFMPPIYTPGGWLWLFKRTADVFKYPVGNQVQVLAALVFLAGLLAMAFNRKQWNRPYLWLAAAPILSTLLASSLHLYPYTGRLVLFLAPSYILLMAAGLEAIAERVKAPQIVAPLLGLILIVPSLFTHKLYMPKNEELKPVLNYVAANQKPNDAVWVYYGAQPGVAYYAPRYKLPVLLGAGYQDYLAGMSHREHEPLIQQDMASELSPAHARHARRLWLVYSHLHGQERALYQQALKADGANLVKTFNSKGAGAYLYQMRP
jgi:hypothetical protein